MGGVAARTLPEARACFSSAAGIAPDGVAADNADDAPGGGLVRAAGARTVGGLCFNGIFFF